MNAPATRRDGSVLLIGCGQMGGALLGAWSDLDVCVHDPHATLPLSVRRLHDLASTAALGLPLTIVIAVKPAAVTPLLKALAETAPPASVFVSVAAGVALAELTAGLRPGSAVVRAMPNTPASVGRAITALSATPETTQDQRLQVETLFRAAGAAVWLDDETQMAAATAISGSGPAYFFRFTEALARAGVALGLPPEMALHLARQTFQGAAGLAEADGASLAKLRSAVTSPGGTTGAALDIFDTNEALDRLVRQAAAAARQRSEALAERSAWSS